MKLSESGEAFLAEARIRILSALEEHGTLTAAELPRRWPATRVLLRHLVDELVVDGLIAIERPASVPGRSRLRLTDDGRTRLHRDRPGGPPT